MTKIEIVKEIITQIKDISIADLKEAESREDKIYRKGLMLIETTFGKDRNYKAQLEDIHNMRMDPFVVTSATPKSHIDNVYRRDFQIKLTKYLNLFETILEELELKASMDIEIKKKVSEPMLQLEKILTRFHLFAKQLKKRQGKATIPIIEVKNEYDVQDLLHALLRIEFDDVRPEEYTPSYAGKSSRIDFLLKKEKILIEVKKTRYDLKDKEIGDELAIDITHYKAHPDCNTLICFVYDPDEFISNPIGLENDLNNEEDDFSVRVLIVPK